MKNRTLQQHLYLPYAFTICMLLLIGGCKKKQTTPDCPVTEPAVVADPTSVTDIDGNVYPVLKICGKLWMVENLRTGRYNDGSSIPTGLDNATWLAASSGAYAIYNDLASNNATYGKLYNWFAVSSGKLAPAGWHVATEAEWKALIECQGGFAVAGGKMKSTSSLWNTPNTGADNSTGFNALPGGYRATTGGYSVMGNTGYWWAATERNATQGEYTKLDNSTAAALSNGATKQFGYSVRCVKD
jgi:uncharacterized protein (TIGR02145 family)